MTDKDKWIEAMAVMWTDFGYPFSKLLKLLHNKGILSEKELVKLTNSPITDEYMKMNDDCQRLFKALLEDE